jgi:hypothetical protein
VQPSFADGLCGADDCGWWVLMVDGHWGMWLMVKSMMNVFFWHVIKHVNGNYGCCGDCCRQCWVEIVTAVMSDHMSVCPVMPRSCV